MESYQLSDMEIKTFIEQSELDKVDELADQIYHTASNLGAHKLACISMDLSLSTTLPDEVLKEALEVFNTELHNALADFEQVLKNPPVI